MELREIASRSILTRTGGFLSGFTHTLNPYRGCSFGKSLCGAACYAPALLRGSSAPWGSFLEVKTDAAEAYRRDLPRERRRGPVRIFCSSVTDPYVPQERRYRVTRALLEAMVADPPDRLALQTHTPGPLRDLDLLCALRCDLSVQISVETDAEAIPGLPPHATSPQERLVALRTLREAGLRAVGVVAPLLPLKEPRAFAQALDWACDFVIVDHYLVGDGSKGGARTQRRGFPDLLIAAGYERWTRSEALEETAALFREVLGEARVGVSAAGFNR
ncbi:MAG: radical SAM protein [Planctomycetaceae bacterium]